LSKSKKTRILDEETTKRLEEEICKKIEEALNMDEVKLEMQSRIEEGRNKLMENITIQLQKRRKTRFKKVTKNT
jgi:arginine/glutamate-rich protein 1